MRVRSRIEFLAEKLVLRTRISCASMPQMLTEQQVHVLRFILVKGRTSGGILQLASLLGVSRQAFGYLTTPLFAAGLIERIPLASDGKGFGGTGLLATKKGAAYLTKVENAELTIEDCILERLSPTERDTFLTLLDKAVGDGHQEVEVETVQAQA